MDEKTQSLEQRKKGSRNDSVYALCKSNIEIVSQDSKNKGLIYKFDIYMDELKGKRFPVHIATHNTNR